MIAMLSAARAWMMARAPSERGATALEYAFVAATIAAVIVLAVGLLGRSTDGNFDCTYESWETRTERC